MGKLDVAQLFLKAAHTQEVILGLGGTCLLYTSRCVEETEHTHRPLDTRHTDDKHFRQAGRHFALDEQ